MSQAEETVQTPAPQRNQARIRVSFARGEALRYVSHLDMQMVWERTLRRAGLPLAYSQGFNPRARLHQASALPLGFLSRHELADFWLNLPVGEAEPDVEALGKRIQAAAPPGLEIVRVENVALNLPALQTLVQSAEYLATPLDPLDADALEQAITALLGADELPRERRGKPYNLRPLIETLETRPGPALWMRLAAREGNTGRPEEVLAALGLDAAAFRVVRTALILQ